MKTLIITLIFTVTLSVTHAQNDSLSLDEAQFIPVQVEAQFPGGNAGWKKHLEKNLNFDLAILVPRKKDEKRATTTVIISFIVDTAGLVSDVKADNLEEVLPQFAAEAIRVIKIGPKWIPAMQNGRKVSMRQTQRITWMYQEK